MDELKKMICNLKGKIPTLSDTDKEALVGLLSSTLNDLNPVNSDSLNHITGTSISSQSNATLTFQENAFFSNLQNHSQPYFHSNNDQTISDSNHDSNFSQSNNSFHRDLLNETEYRETNMKSFNTLTAVTTAPLGVEIDADESNIDEELTQVRRSSRKRKCAKPTKLDLNNYCEDNPLLKCSECSSTFACHGAITLHLKKDHPTNELSCIFCKGTFINPAAFHLHECLQSEQKFFITRKCAMCEKTFNSKISFTKHKRMVHNDQQQPFKCQLCKAIFSQKKKLWCHIKTEHSASMKTCRECCTMLKCLDSLMDHYATAHNLPIGCRLCEMAFRSHAALKKHLLKTHKRQCVLCELKMSSLRELDNHYLSHHNLRLGLTPDTKANLKKTRTNFVIDSIANNPTAVDSSNEDGSSVNNLRISLRRCSNKNRYILNRNCKPTNAAATKDKSDPKQMKTTICYICGKSYSRVHTLKRHMLTHNNEYPYKCSYCEFKTVEKSNLDQHLARHFEFKQFQCRICQKSFVEKRALSDHILFKHNTQKNYSCSVCGKAFKTAGVLSRHKKIHTPDKLYECICGINFNRLSNLRRHYMVVHHKSNQATVIPRFRALTKFNEPPVTTEEQNGGLPTLDEELEQEVVNGTQVISLTPDNMISHDRNQPLEPTRPHDSQQPPQILMNHSTVNTPCTSSCLNPNINVMMNHTTDPSLYHHNQQSSSSNKNLDHLWRPMVDGLESTSVAASTSYTTVVDSRLLPNHDDVIWSTSHYGDTFNCLMEPSVHQQPLQNATCSLLSATDAVLLPHCQPASICSSTISHPVDSLSSCLISNDSLLSGLLPQSELQNMFMTSSAPSNTVLPSMSFTSQTSHQNYANQQCSDFSVGYLIGSNPSLPHTSNFTMR